VEKKNFIKIVFALALLVFASFAAWRESAQANLKTGIALYVSSNPAAEDVLRTGVDKNGGDYLLRYYAALSLQKNSFAMIAKGMRPDGKLIEAREHLNAALDIRFDTADHQALGRNFALEGRMGDALAHYNIAFFFSQNTADLAQMPDIRQYQTETARDYFERGSLGVPLIMAFNTVTGFSPSFAGSPTSRFLESFFSLVPPDGWISATVERRGEALKEMYRRQSPGEKELIAAGLNSAGFVFLSAYMEEK